MEHRKDTESNNARPSAAEVRVMFEANNPSAKGGTYEAPADSGLSEAEITTGKSRMAEARAALNQIHSEDMDAEAS